MYVRVLVRCALDWPPGPPILGEIRAPGRDPNAEVSAQRSQLQSLYVAGVQIRPVFRYAAEKGLAAGG